MFYLKFTAFLVCMACIVIRSYGMPDMKEDISVNCSILRKCSTVEDTVWATDLNQCYLFRNPCIFANEMCLRKDKKLDVLKVVTQDECKKYCRGICTAEYAPVCGEYGNDYKTFSNKCSLYAHSCRNGQSYIFLHVGECIEDIATYK